MKYQVIYSRRTTLALQVTRDGELLVRVPEGCPEQTIENAVLRHEAWAKKKIEEAGRRKNFWPLLMPEEERELRERAKKVLREKADFYAEKLGVSYGKITIRGQKTRWGSCTAAGNLSFNWKLMLCPEAVQDYVVVHELAHRKEMNHSREFYRIMEEILPDYRERQRWLREHP